MKPRVLFVGRTRYQLPLQASLARKWDAVSERMDIRVLASGTGSDPRFRLVPPRALDGPRFYATLPFVVAQELRAFRPDVIIAESPYEAAAVRIARSMQRSPAKLVVEVHGDWRLSTRLYGSRLRSALAPVSDALARSAVRSADGHRALSANTASLVRSEGREPTGVFPTYSDLSSFTGPPVPLPAEPRAVFVGVLERYKDVDLLADAWRVVAERVPGAQLHIVGTGRQTDVAESLAREGVRWDRRLTPGEVAAALDGARALLLPSPAEGLGRVAIEAFLRGRPVVGTRSGGIPDIVEDGTTGLLVTPGDVEGFAAAIVRTLTEPGLAERLGAAAHAASASWLATPEQYADNVLAVVRGVAE